MDIEKYLKEPAFTLHEEFIEICKGHRYAACLIPFFLYHHKKLLINSQSNEIKQYHTLDDFIAYGGGYFGKLSLKQGLVQLESLGIISIAEDHYIFHLLRLEELFFETYSVVEK